MSNSFLFVIHVFFVGGLSLLSLRIGKEAMIAWLCLLALSANLFVHKQVTLFGLDVTCSDALAVGYLLGLNLIQEFFGKSEARRTVWISFFISAVFVLLSQIHLRYQPNAFDATQSHFSALFTSIPRVVFASLLSFLLVQFFDLSFLSYLRKKTEGKYFLLRTLFAAFLSQTLDTAIFTFVALYGVVESIGEIFLFSLIIKAIVILLSTPFVALSKRVRYVQV